MYLSCGIPSAIFSLCAARFVTISLKRRKQTRAEEPQYHATTAYGQQKVSPEKLHPQDSSQSVSDSLTITSLFVLIYLFDFPAVNCLLTAERIVLSNSIVAIFARNKTAMNDKPPTHLQVC